jgi:hypothetical protein
MGLADFTVPKIWHTFFTKSASVSPLSEFKYRALPK